MKLKKIIGALALIGASAGVFAADQNVAMNASNVGFYNGTFGVYSDLFNGGSDFLSLTGLATGNYNVTLSVNTINSVLDVTATKNANGFAQVGLGNTFGPVTQYTFVASTQTPIKLEIFGTSGGAGAMYFGNVTASLAAPVPEPESYAMFLAGLGIMGAVARRRAAKQA